MPTDMTGLISISRAEGKQAAETLARAFHDYPLLKYYFPDSSKREKITYYFIASSVFSATRYGEVYATSVNMEGVAVWVLSDRYPKSIIDGIRAIPLSISFGLFWHGVYRLKAVGDHIEAVKARLAPARHMFL
jgi:hypothetical protein